MKKMLALIVALFALALPAAALAAPNEGPGTVSVGPDPLVVPATTVGYQGESLAVDVSYDGEGEAGIEKIVLSGGETGEFSSTGSNCGVLQSGQHCTAWFALKPTSLGEKTATLEITFQNGRAPELRSISGRSVPPQLSFSPSSLDFGVQRVNRESATEYLQVTNSGEAPVQVSNFEVQGDNYVFSYGSSSCASLLAPGQSCSIQVYFAPNEQRDFAAELRAYTGGDYFSAALSGRGGRAVIAPATNPVGFGSLAVGASVVKTITLTNSGDLPGAFFIAVVAGGDVGSFRLLSEHCTMVEIQPSESCSVRVRFEPQETGPLAARLAMFGDGDDAMMVQLEGKGLPAAVVAPGEPVASSALEPGPVAKPRPRRFARNKSLHAPRRTKADGSKASRQSKSSTRSGVRGSS